MFGSSDRRYREGGPMDDVAQNIRNEQQAEAMPRTTPPQRCHECDHLHPWDHYKNHGRVPDTPDDPLLCSICNGGLRAKSVEDREAENHAIGEFLSPGGGAESGDLADTDSRGENQQQEARNHE